MRCHENKLTYLGFQAFWEIFNIISKSLESNYKTKFIVYTRLT